MGLLDRQVAIVTGAGQGLGKAIATEFAREGAHSVLLDRNASALEDTRRELALTGCEVQTFALDITDYTTFGEIVKHIIHQHGQVDVLVNNAGIFATGTIIEDRLEDWRSVLGVNLEAVYMGTKLVAPHMAARNYGRIINIASVAGFASRGNVGSYNAAKGAVIDCTHSMAVELGKHNILVNAIAPGFMRTAMMVSGGVDGTMTQEFQNWYTGRNRIPMRRAGLPEDVSGTAVFLASAYCRYMTGQVLVVDGGLTSTF